MNKPYSSLKPRARRQRLHKAVWKLTDKDEATDLCKRLQNKFGLKPVNQVSHLSLLVLVKKLRLSYNQVRKKLICTSIENIENIYDLENINS